MKDRILPDHWSYRPDTWDWNIFDSVCIHNEYALPNPLPANSLVVDIGAHIGSFCWAVHTLGAAAIVAIEMQSDNVQHLLKNLAPIPRHFVWHCAAWNDHDETQLHEPTTLGVNTGGGGVFSGDGRTVLAIPISRIFRHAVGWSGIERVRLMKLDCEGSEYPILLGADLSLVDAVCGELHDGVHWGDRVWTHRDVVEMLTAAGFSLRVTPTAPGFWHLWADKPSFYQ